MLWHMHLRGYYNVAAGCAVEAADGGYWVNVAVLNLKVYQLATVKLAVALGLS